MAKIKKPKKQKFVEPYFQEMVKIWFDFCREQFHEDPTFDGSAPRDLKSIIKSLRERAEKSKIEWSLLTAQHRFSGFLKFAWEDLWLSQNWMLFNINRQKDKIFYKIRAAIQRQPTEHPFD